MFKDGNYDSTFSITWNMDNGEIHHWTPTYIKGISLPMQNTTILDDGRYDIAMCDNCGANLIGSDDTMNQVFGLFKRLMTS